MAAAGKGGEAYENVEAFPSGRGCSGNGGADSDHCGNLHLYIEYIEGEKFPKNKLYTRYTQEHGQLKLSKKGK